MYDITLREIASLFIGIVIGMIIMMARNSYRWVMNK